ncbi:MAG: PQQ-binding-like beta-propeller repeat protein [Planctomycetota bacterium]|nr:PQQ-binding-like beta-propeller repeat protein [Planctomycetota bacterium]
MRIVDFGHDFLRDGDGRPRHQFGCHRYVLAKDPQTGLAMPGQDPVRLDLTVDVDGDGRSDDDMVAYMPFSLTRPFSPVTPWYDHLAGTPRWYGGAAIFQADRRTTGFSENGVNQEHDGPLHLPRDNWALFHETYEIYSPYRLYALWLWKKHDFLNGGADFPVNFDETTEIALYLQRYFMGIDGVRFVVRDGEQFYTSQAVFRGAGQVRGSGDGKQHILCPLETKWAKYNPRAPHDIAFNPKSATFEQREFRDVTAVGFYVFKDKPIPAYFGFKWYAFEVDAVVRRRERPSESIDMVKVGGEGVPPFYISTCEVPYVLWKNVFRLARSNTFVRDPRGFIFDKDGDMGSMDFPGPDGNLLSHSPDEPVADLTLHDAAAWCNALSVQESRTPCYYEDPEFETVLHFVKQSVAYVKKRPLPKLHVKWDADGYRLPTPAEWRAALAGQEPSADTAWVAANSAGQTRAVGQKTANTQGLHDMLGNAWELVWTFAKAYDPVKAPHITALGGDFRHPQDPTGASASPYGDEPYRGSYSIGFRLVRRDEGLAPPREARIDPSIPQWTIRRGETVKPPGGPRPIARPMIAMARIPGKPLEVGKTEVTFAKWKQVHDWAVAHGYSFDRDGDMGSMDYWGSNGWGAPHAHSPDEPVTDITGYDAMVWCNALSEIEGREPVYHEDVQLMKVYRRAFVHRPLMLLFFEAGKLMDEGAVAKNRMSACQPVYVKPDADGYRLPSEAEADHAATAGAGARYSWGRDPRAVARHAWTYDTSNGTTHPVGRKRPNALGLCDVEGNVSEYAQIPGKPWSMLRLGGSFLDLTSGIRRGGAPFSPAGWGYPDQGFRVVRQAPTRTSSGRRGPAAQMFFAPALDALPDAPPPEADRLQGKVYRANLRRDGVFAVPGLAKVKGLRWKFRTGGPVKSSPVAVGGVVYFGSWDGCIYAVDAANGQKLWKAKTGDKVSGSAAVVGGVVYMASEDGYAYALDARTGKTKWKAHLARRSRPAGSPAVVGDVVYFPSGNRGGAEVVYMTAGPIVGLDIKTGRKVWSTSSGPQGYGSPAIVGETLWAGIGGNSWAVYDLQTGKVRTQLHMSGQSRQFVTCAISGDLAYIVGTICGDIAAIDVRTTRRVWSQFTLEGQVHVRCDGEAGYEIFTAPAVAHGRVYIGCNDGKLHTFDARRGIRGWTFQTDGPVHSSPAIAGRAVYFGSWDGHLYALDASSGRLLWKFAAGDRIVSSPWPTADTVYVGCDDGHLYAVH